VGQGSTFSLLRSYPRKSGIYLGKIENIRVNLKMKTIFRDHTNPMRKKGKFLRRSFLENTLLWKYFVLNIWADSLCPSTQTVLLSYSYD